ncbi:MAG: hypothetical protein ACI9WU_000636 [Myxococcota bacterium]|jgi:hypothetical protein
MFVKVKTSPKSQRYQELARSEKFRTFVRQIGMLQFLVALSLCACADAPTSRAHKGARIAEPAEGPWVDVCAVDMKGPPRPEERGTGEARHQTRRQAHRLATASACNSADGGPSCVGLSGDWSVDTENCSRIETEGRPGEHRCRITVTREAGERTAVASAEGRSAEKACERARKRACRDMAGGTACVRLEDGWTARSTRGRRRPTGERPGARRPK